MCCSGCLHCFFHSTSDEIEADLQVSLEVLYVADGDGILKLLPPGRIWLGSGVRLTVFGSFRLAAEAYGSRVRLLCLRTLVANCGKGNVLLNYLDGLAHASVILVALYLFVGVLFFVADEKALRVCC